MGASAPALAPDGGEPAAPDNNKRLAALEAGISGLVVQMRDAGWPLGEQEDPLGLAGAIISGFAAEQKRGASFHEFLTANQTPLGEGEGCYDAAERVIAELQAKLGGIPGALMGLGLDGFEPIDGEDPVNAVDRFMLAAGEALAAKPASEDAAAAVKRADDLEVKVGQLEDANKTLSEDLELARAAFAHAKGEALKVGRKLPRSTKARKIVPMEINRELLAAAMVDALDPMQIVFSNGATEIIELEPLAVYPPAFRLVQADQYRLIEDVLVKGSRDGTRVRGFGLVVDGKQIAWQAIEPVDLPAGQERKFQVQF